MWPHDLHLGPISLGGYGLALVAAVLGALFYLNRMAPRAGVCPKRAFDLAFWLIIAGLVGSRLAYVIFNPKNFLNSPLKAFKYWEGGLMFQGGLILGLLVVIVLAALGRFKFLLMADALAPALALGQAIGRLGCFVAGCCYGRLAPSHFPLALTFPPGSLAPAGIPLYPTQLAESLGLLAICFLLTKVLNGPRPAGLILALYLSLAGFLRFVVDLFRGDYRGPQVLDLAPTSYAAAGLALLGLALTIFLLLRDGKFRQSLP
ncbi:MAG: prolipoprotein diacylglyceryl transferase [Deltaproteobacteria bacterium]|jgi:phosphatidylglycerol:prolipoprotein diacylglycerol transferase|nr:prolipoprotein diacylglyceryl transferase [Deltaproteobacteria bacterium]